MKADETLMYDLLTQIYRDKKVTDATFNATQAKFGDKGLSDIVAIAFASVFGAVALAVAIAVGVGGRHVAARLLETAAASFRTRKDDHDATGG